MSPWMVNPAWQNFSSLYREAVAAEEAKTGVFSGYHAYYASRRVSPAVKLVLDALRGPSAT